MKHLKTYEGVKSKMNFNIELRNKMNKFSPGMFIIYTITKYNFSASKYVKMLVLGRIQRTEIEHNKNKFDDEILDTYVHIVLCDFISDIETETIQATDKVPIDYLINNKLYITSSIEDIKTKFEELKPQYQEQWLIDQSANKYNL